MWQSTMIINLTNIDLDYLDVDPETNEIPKITEKWASTLGIKKNFKKYIFKFILQGIAISFSAVGASILIATFMDYFRKRMKIAIIILLSVSGVVCAMATLVAEKVVQFNDIGDFKIFMYVTLIAGVSLACGAAPIAFEFCVEICYPVSEGLLGICYELHILFCLKCGY